LPGRPSDRRNGITAASCRISNKNLSPKLKNNNFS
jgi:hypothetical protein